MKKTVLAVSILVLSLPTSGLAAQAWPTKPLRVVIPVAAGSSTDIVHRLVLERLAVQLGQPVVVENRAGAGGTIGTNIVAKADPDGYSILAHGSAHTITPALYKTLPYHPTRDFIPVAPVGISPSILVVPPSRNWRTVADLIAAARSQPGKLNFSSVGLGTATHLSAERFVASAGIEAVHVPFKGGAAAMLEVVSDRVDLFFGPVALVLPNIREGKLRALAVNSTARSKVQPDVPTLRESGLNNTEFPIWYALFAPAKTPAELVNRLNRETLRALQAPRVRDFFAEMGIDHMDMTPAEFAKYVEREIVQNAELAGKVGLKAQ